MNKKKIVWGVVGIIVLVAVFYIGVSYGKSQVPASNANTVGAAYGGGTRTGRTGGGFGGLTTGQIISKNAQSITISLPSGGSEIVFFDSSTKITKSTSGTMADLTTGSQVSIAGTPNSDGSVNAQTIQIRPNMPTTPTSASPNTTQ